MDNKFFSIISFAVLIEGCITYMSQFFINDSFSWKMLLSIILGIITAIAYNIDLPSYFSLKSTVPLVGNILSGILISRGSNYVYDLLTALVRIK